MIRTDKAHLPVAASTHEGMRGKNNEDRYAVSSFQLNPSQGALPVLLAVVSDGVGGHRAGEVASEMTVNMISKMIEQSSGEFPSRTLVEAIRSASNQIYALGQTTADFFEMGATVACVMIVGHRLYDATVGDSRVYLMRDGQAHQISRDHTWIQEALKAGIIRPEDVHNHPNAHVIRRYLGSPLPPEVDLGIHLTGHENEIQAEANQGMLLKAGDKLLLCSDGLSDLVSGSEMLACLNTQSLDTAVKALIDLANSRGGHDNITLIAIDVSTSASRWEHLITPRNISMAAVGGVAFAGLIVLLFAGLWFYNWMQSKISTSSSATQPVIIYNSLLTPQASSTPMATFTFDPKLSFDKILEPSQTPTPRYHSFTNGEATLTPWPNNTHTPTPTTTATLTPTTPLPSTQAVTP
jgi:PPM family protein phosphatase